MKEVISTTQAPAPIGPYSQAVRLGNLVFSSGQIALNAGTSEIELRSIELETKQVMQNVEAVLKAAGCSFDDVLSTTIYLTDLANFAEVNELYGAYFSDSFPARTTVQVSALPKNARVEISFIAATNKQAHNG